MVGDLARQKDEGRAPAQLCYLRAGAPRAGTWHRLRRPLPEASQTLGELHLPFDVAFALLFHPE